MDTYGALHERSCCHVRRAISAVSARTCGRTNTAINVLAFLGGFLVQSSIGFLLAQFPVNADGGYDPGGHRLALGIVVVIQVAAFAWFFLAARLDRSSPALS